MTNALIIGIAIAAALFVAAGVVPLDPDERRPGRTLAGSLAVNQLSDFAELPRRAKIYVETATPYWIPHSVTTVAWSDDGQLYVPCGACARKVWPKNVARDPNVRLKIDGEIYERTAVPIGDPAAVRRLLSIPAERDLPNVAIYRMDPR